MTKVVYNACYGGFSLSDKAVELGRKLSNDPTWGGPCLEGDFYNDGTPCRRKGSEAFGKDWNHCLDLDRHDPILVQVVEILGEEADGKCANLKIEEIGSNQYKIDEYDGRESVITRETESGWVSV